jgi:hypothetical protein
LHAENHSNFVNLHGPPVVSIMLRSRTFRKHRHRYASCALCGVTLPSWLLRGSSQEFLKASDPPQTHPFTTKSFFFYCSNDGLPAHPTRCVREGRCVRLAERTVWWRRDIVIYASAVEA